MQFFRSQNTSFKKFQNFECTFGFISIQFQLRKFSVKFFNPVAIGQKPVDAGLKSTRRLGIFKLLSVATLFGTLENCCTDTSDPSMTNICCISNLDFRMTEIWDTTTDKFYEPEEFKPELNNYDTYPATIVVKNNICGAKPPKQ